MAWQSYYIISLLFQIIIINRLMCLTFSFFSLVGYKSFKASKYWLHKWKKKNNIVSRKITKVMSRKQIQSLPDVAEKVNKYREEKRALIAKYQPNGVLNSDQSGFNFELLSGRTLTEKDDKKVVSSIHQSHSGTHSYTIQPLISMTGHLYPRLLIVLQEKSGKLGPVVLQNLSTHPEILVLANSSGKVTKEILMVHRNIFSIIQLKKPTSSGFLKRS